MNPDTKYKVKKIDRRHRHRHHRDCMDENLKKKESSAPMEPIEYSSLEQVIII